MSSHDSFVASGTSPTSDFRCENHGSILLLFPLSQAGQSWIKENLPSNAQWFGNAMAVEHRRPGKASPMVTFDEPSQAIN